MSDVVIAEFDKNSRDRVRVTLTTFAGLDTIDIRVYYRDDATAEYKPGRAGLSLRRELIPDLLSALQKAAEMQEADEEPDIMEIF